MTGATHIYIGERTLWGLEPGTPVRIVGHRGGTIVKRVSDGRRFMVIRGDLQVITPAAHGRRPIWRKLGSQMGRHHSP